MSIKSARLNNVWYTHTLEYNTVILRSELESNGLTGKGFPQGIIDWKRKK